MKLSAAGTKLSNPELYRSLLGKLNFLTNTRPDLRYSVQVLSQFMHSPTTFNYEVLLRTLSYVNHTAGQGILLRDSDRLTLQAYSDSDWASCPDTRHSVTCYIVLFGSSPIAWKSKKQANVSRSSLEAEYQAITSAASEITWVVRLL